MGYNIDFKNGSRYVFFSEKGAVSNFFFRKGGGRPKKVGNLWFRQSVSYKSQAACDDVDWIDLAR
jgi:hypothetical protein